MAIKVCGKNTTFAKMCWFNEIVNDSFKRSAHQPKSGVVLLLVRFELFLVFKWICCCCYRCSFYIPFVIGLCLGQNDSRITKNTVKNLFSRLEYVIWSIINFESRFLNDCRCTRLILFFVVVFFSLGFSVRCWKQVAYQLLDNLQLISFDWKSPIVIWTWKLLALAECNRRSNTIFCGCCFCFHIVYYSSAYHINVYEMYDCGL